MLRRCRAVVDCGHLVLYLNVDPAKQLHLGAELARAGWTRVPMTSVGHDFAVPCEVNGHRFRLYVDTGAPLTTLDRDFVRGAGVGSRDVIGITAGIIGTQGSGIAVADTRSIQIGGYTVANTYFITQSGLHQHLGSDVGSSAPLLGLLGGDLLSKNNAFIDIGEQALDLKAPGSRAP